MHQTPGGIYIMPIARARLVTAAEDLNRVLDLGQTSIVTSQPVSTLTEQIKQASRLIRLTETEEGPPDKVPEATMAVLQELGCFAADSTESEEMTEEEVTEEAP